MGGRRTSFYNSCAINKQGKIVSEELCLAAPSAATDLPHSAQDTPLRFMKPRAGEVSGVWPQGKAEVVDSRGWSREMMSVAIHHWHRWIIIGWWILIPISSPALADFDTALTAFKKGNFTEAFKQLQPLEQQGDPRAQLLLGVMYLGGDGVKRNYETAARWFRKSAEQGDETAAYKLGLLYERGKGVPRDMSQAAHMYRCAAEGSQTEAQYRLAQLYVTGKGVKKNTVEALMWLHLAARQGQEDALFLLARLAQQMTKAQVNEAQRQVKEWKALSPRELDYLCSKEWALNTDNY